MEPIVLSNEGACYLLGAALLAFSLTNGNYVQLNFLNYVYQFSEKLMKRNTTLHKLEIKAVIFYLSSRAQIFFSP